MTPEGLRKRTWTGILLEIIDRAEDDIRKDLRKKISYRNGPNGKPLRQLMLRIRAIMPDPVDCHEYKNANLYTFHLPQENKTAELPEDRSDEEIEEMESHACGQPAPAKSSRSELFVNNRAAELRLRKLPLTASQQTALDCAVNASPEDCAKLLADLEKEIIETNKDKENGADKETENRRLRSQ